MATRTQDEERGTFLRYQNKSFRPETLALIRACNEIIDRMEKQGFTLTLRQLYYQCVTVNLIPNTQPSYNRLQRIISDARLAGLVSWTALEDRGRNLMGHRTYTGPGAAIKQLLAGYKIDLWANQEWRPEVWVEKQAMESVVGRIAGELRVDFYATKGYDSQSQAWRAGHRFAQYVRKGQRPIVFHLGDHDPSGLDMTNDIRSRLELFAGTPVMVQRLALNRAQIEEYGPPPNPAKDTDARFAAYAAEHGDESWELDALDPMVIMQTIRQAVLMIRNPDDWEAAQAQEQEDLEALRQAAEGM